MDQHMLVPPKPLTSMIISILCSGLKLNWKVPTSSRILCQIQPKFLSNNLPQEKEIQDRRKIVQDNWIQVSSFLKWVILPPSKLMEALCPLILPAALHLSRWFYHPGGPDKQVAGLTLLRIMLTSSAVTGFKFSQLTKQYFVSLTSTSLGQLSLI